MAGPGDELGAAGRGHLRASHADREQVIGILKTAFVQGMLAKDEFDLRVGQTLASRTYADLAAVTADLPAGLAAAPPPASVRAPGEQPVLRPGPVIAAASGMYAGVWASVVFLANHSAEAPWAPPLIFGSFLVYLLILIMSVVQMAALRRGKRSGGQSSRRPSVGGQASQRLPSADPGRQLPLADPGRGDTAESAPMVRPRLVPS
jgi:hypothetical protein